MTSTATPNEGERFLRDHPDTALVDLLIPDLCGVLRGKRIHGGDLPKLFTEGCMFPGSIFGMDITGASIGETGLVWECGDADQPCFPVAGTLKRVPWLDRPGAQVMLTMQGDGSAPFEPEPRQVLARVIAMLREIGLYPVAALELEFYLMDDDWGPGDLPRPPLSPASGFRPTTTQVYGLDDLYDFDAVLTAIDEAALSQSIPTDALVAEYAPGQFEINLKHRADALAAADDAVLFKRAVRGVAARHKFDATFMAKPYGDEAGSGLHVHVSLVDETGRNVFADPLPEGSDMLGHAIAGLAETMGDAMALFAPNANSYRRFLPESYAPMAPTWGVNNRTVALRVPSGPAEARRVEHRVAGADANPYLALAAILGGMHHGIVNRLPRPPATTGNAYEKAEPTLPTSWAMALDHLAQSETMRHYLGDRFVDVFMAVKRAERTKYFQVISPVEYDWYFRTA